MLHCVDEEDPNVNKTDKIYKSRSVFDIILRNFQHCYVPDCELSLDEGMIPTKNKLSIKQYIKDKPIRWGLKTFLLCESSTGYIINAEIYTGKIDADPELPAELGVTGSLVARLCKPYNGRNHCVFTDRFYTSVVTAEHLLSQGTRLCGTALTNRKKFPKHTVQKKMDRGSHSVLFNGKTAAFVWCDKKPIYFLATKYVTAETETVLRYDAKEHKRMPVSCPAVVKAYNTFMGGTDKNDQMTKLQKCRRHYKWPRRLMVKFFVWCAYNAYIIQGQSYKPHKVPGKRLHTFRMFVDELCHDLVGTHRRVSTPMSRRKSGADEERLQSTQSIPIHLPERPQGATSNNRCVVCTEKYKQAKRANLTARDTDLPKRCKTVYWCKSCQVFLCIASGNENCFEAYHSKVQFWR